MDRAHFDDDDSNPVNGWIKKEIEDDDFYDDINMDQVEEHSGDRYEELMCLSKEDLVGRILQQEEDIRYLQDIRQGLDKNVQSFSASCSQFKNLIDVLSTTITSMKTSQPAVSPTTPGTSNRAASANSTPSMTSRSSVNVPSSQASPRSTPNVHTNAATAPPSLRSTPNAPMTPLNQRSNPSNTPASHVMTQNVMSSDRLHSGSSVSSHQTVTITRQTNVVIKTEIPSPPPEDALITNTPMSSTNVSSSTASHSNQKAAPSFHQVRQQQQQQQQTQQQQQQQQQQTPQQTTKPFLPNASRSITDIANSIPPHRGRMRGNASGFNAGMRGNMQNRMNNQQQQQFQMQRQSMAQGNFPVGRGGRGRGHANQRSAPYSTQKQMQTPVSVGATMTRGRAATAQAARGGGAGSGPGMNNLLANINLKVPSGITLSIVPPKQGGPDKTSKASLVEGGIRAGEDSSKLTDKSGNSVMQGKFQDEDEEEDYFDEIAVLIPDKGSPLDGSKTSDSNMSNALVSADLLSDNQNNAFWNSGKKQTNPPFTNNAEYMFEEAEDLDSDENDNKFYLSDDVSLPRELLDSCLKQGSNPTKLTLNLMEALFPNSRELANSCAEQDGNQPMQTLLPGNKVKAIVELVQKTFPKVRRLHIINTMNMRCKEVKEHFSRSRSQNLIN